MSEPFVEQGQVDDVSTFVLHDPDNNAVAEVAAVAGFNCFRFEKVVNRTSVPILFSTNSGEALKKGGTGFGFPLLFPFPNRVKAGKYSFRGKEYTIGDMFKAGNHIHGLVLDKEWLHVESGISEELGAYVTGTVLPEDFPGSFNQQQYPFPFRFSLTYSLKGGELLLDTVVENTGDGPLPFGFGSHPYFPVPILPGSLRDQLEIMIPANQFWELVECIPTGERLDVTGKFDCRDFRPLGQDTYDDVFTDLILENGKSSCVLRDRNAGLQIRIWADSAFREWVVYAPLGRPMIAFEPYTCPTDAVNLEARGIKCGWIELPPGETWQARKGVRLEQI
ncbi:MAG: aldose 1-epimerase [Planctomycetota bacterium]|nr:aldose 1-epimerase [Planctomycetota bacterium]